MPLPGNIILSDFSGASGSIFTPAPIVNNAAALVFYIQDTDRAKKLLSVTYSLSRNPFMTSGLFPVTQPPVDMFEKIFGRLSVFKTFSQDPSALFEPYFDSGYTNALAPPNNHDYYGARINYQKDDMLLDVVISRIPDSPITFDLHAETIPAQSKIVAVLSPFYSQRDTATGVNIFGNYLGDGLIRTLSFHGCLAYG
jgi:hypothetical protein